MIFDAAMSLASTCRSEGERLDKSPPISVGANLAAICCSFTVSGTEASWARTSNPTLAHTMAIATARPNSRVIAILVA